MGGILPRDMVPEAVEVRDEPFGRWIVMGK